MFLRHPGIVMVTPTIQCGPPTVIISEVITPLIEVITPVTYLSYLSMPFIGVITPLITSRGLYLADMHRYIAVS